MKILYDLLMDVECKVKDGDIEVGVTELCYDSRKVTEGSCFVAISGTNFDGHDYIESAVRNGATSIVCEWFPDDIDTHHGVTIVQTADTRKALAYMSAAFFNYPANEVKVIGITGTKGKTTTTYLIKSVLDHAGFDCGLMGTIETIIGDEHIPAENTTPESFIIQKNLRKMADAGMKYCVMEVSSQGLMMDRTAGIPFLIGIFTNLSPDHIGPNEHSSFAEYLRCKGLLFRQCEIGIVNADDENVDEILRGHTCYVQKFGINNPSDIMARDIKFIHDNGRLATMFKTDGDVALQVELNLPGYFSVYNALSAISVCKALDANDNAILYALKNAKIRGRIESVDTGSDFSVIIDYAHNALSLESILKTLREYEPARLISVFGCGGNRDPERRFQMGEVSGKYADLTIITSDNPRFEEPLDIMENIKTGIERTNGEYVMVEDRKEALRYAVKNARPKDVILLAGKGHEDYQEIKGVKHHMDEVEIVKEVLLEEGFI